MPDDSTTAEEAGTLASTFNKLDIDLDGDVYLCSEDFKLLVSSKVLSVASPVFKKLFGPHFMEGSQLSTTSPGTVSLSEDNAEVVVALCQILHHRYSESVESLTFSFINNLAVVADKYDCVQSLMYFSANYFYMKMRQQSSGFDVGRLIFSAFLFDNPIIFREVTKSMVYSLLSTDYRRLADTWLLETGLDAGDFLLKDLLARLAEKQLEVKHNLQVELETVMSSLISKTLPFSGRPSRGPHFSGEASHSKNHISECDCTTVTLYLHAFKVQRLWPLTTALKNKNLVEFLQDLRATPFPTVKVDSCGCSSCGLDIKAKVNTIVQSTEAAFDGLCLDCVKYGKREESGRECRIAHPGYIDFNSSQ
ncbi:hypothetical protein MMC30_001932 [Trapelia coarctata]|nr:hypothetical protein [Trapelia coarctata]